MKKRILLAIGLSVSLSFASESLQIPLDEAVQVNTKLINLLFEENKILKEEMNQIKTKMNETKYSNTPLVKNAPYNSNSIQEKFVLEDARNKIVMSDINIRDYPKINSNVVGVQEKGTVVQCVDFENNWCKTTAGTFIWGDNLKDITLIKVITKKKTNLRGAPSLNSGNVIQTVGEGIVLNAVSYTKGWYKLEDNSFVSDKNVAKYCK